MASFKDYFINEVKKESKKYQPKSNSELKELVKDLNINLGDIDVSKISDFTSIFEKSNRTDFSGLETWDMSKATTLKRMFHFCEKFNHNINSWNVSNVIDMGGLFHGCFIFNQPLDKWKVDKVQNMSEMFRFCNEFNQPLNNWNVKNVYSFEMMFYSADNFNQPLNKWDVSGPRNVRNMFGNTKSFNQDISMWDSSKWSNQGSYRDMFWGSKCEVKNQPYLRPYWWKGWHSANKTFPATDKQIKYAEYLEQTTKMELPYDYKNDKYELTIYINKAKKKYDFLKRLGML